MSTSSKDAKAAVILAAGKGTRMKTELPKVAALLAGQPLLGHVMDNLLAAGFRRLIFIVGYKQEVVRELVESHMNGLDDQTIAAATQIEFAEQTEQLGTGHAFLQAEQALQNYSGPILAASGDQPMISAQTFGALLKTHTSGGHGVTVLTAKMPEPFGYGRIVREGADSSAGQIERIVEEKDATDEQRKIDAVYTGTYVYQGPAIFSVLHRVGSNNAQNEYYLPDALELNRADGQTNGSFRLDDQTEAQGVNSPVELKLLEEKLKLAKSAD